MSLVINKLSSSIDDKTLFNEVSFTITNGNFGLLSGESGIGKSTLLNNIAGLNKPDFRKSFAKKASPTLRWLETTGCNCESSFNEARSSSIR